ncbi:MAG TPA: RdgB/HAM1 family non-canonical purine NTP pyrophosphatase [Saprospiraceae bacterium]|nr:RdgB/HAM1 family non-canonical purine NTP pyrophosphatase [Saprospiraceae bacterium]
MKKIILATQNPHKLTEIRSVTAHLPLKIISLTDLGYDSDIVEHGATLEENAMIKATIIFHQFGLPVIGEDTGLEVYALNMEPGVNTARYAGVHKNAEDNMDKLLLQLKQYENRNARFRTCIAYTDGLVEWVVEGIVEGNIAAKKSGSGGFGYDPIFIPEGYDETFAQLSMDIKNKISHRARAMVQCIERLNLKYL